MLKRNQKNYLKNTNNDTKREVWIVISGLSKNVLEKELKKNNSATQSEELHQLMWFTQNMQDTFSSFNVRMKILCKE